MTDKATCRWFPAPNLEACSTAKRLLVPKAAKLSLPRPSFGIDPLKTYRQALAGLSWLSYSSLASARRRARHRPILPCRQERNSPRRPRSGSLAREICLPWVDYAMRCMASPTLNTDGLRQKSIARFSASPPFGRTKIYRIEFQDYSVLWELHYHSSSV